MNDERRVFEREQIGISFIYSLDSGNSILEGEWFETTTQDIGPVLVGGLAFLRDEPIEVGTDIRIALFMDLKLKNSWKGSEEQFPALYYGTVCRVEEIEVEPAMSVPADDEFSPMQEETEATDAETDAEGQTATVAEPPEPATQYKIAVSFKGFELQENE